eukprot:TRINITY_DN5294_c0_g1_i1.p2 TRINITY_DN5294_c0_g1~~TRINITY_DN5294_c0_g1_i1.p2  ORF type:complete len:192 (+),score=51.44 TRINITY_DN5294_c0_g1_i1:63-638(+)
MCIRDSHQPLHASAFINGTYSTPKGDSGGNKYFVEDDITGQDFGNLHYLWDSGIGLLKALNERPIKASSLEYVRKVSEEIMKNYTKEHFGPLAKEKSVLKWAQESLQLANDYAYGPLNGSKVITKEYQAQAFEVIKSQLALGGYRLAQKLRDALRGQDFGQRGTILREQEGKIKFLAEGDETNEDIETEDI